MLPWYIFHVKYIYPELNKWIYSHPDWIYYMEDTICKALSLTGQEVVPEDIHACHQMSNRDRVIVKFKDRKLKHNVQKNVKIYIKNLENFQD